MTWRELNDQLGKSKDGKLVLKFYKAERKGNVARGGGRGFTTATAIFAERRK